MTAAIDHKALFDAIRRVKGSPLTQADVDAINLVLVGATKPLAWGAKVSPAFRARVRDIAEALGCSPDDLMTCMAWESGRSFSPSVRNMAGSGATGLIQFMPDTARELGTSVADLVRMTAERQLDFVEAYFRPWRGKLENLGDLYMAILWPRAVGKPDSYVLWSREQRPTTYRQNAGLDLNRDGVITRAECLVKLHAMRAEGLMPENVA
jgi:hypothetical protein